MEDCITVNVQGAITIPARLCEAYGIKPNDKLLVQPTGDGLLLRPVAGESIEVYTEDRIAEFATDEDALGSILPPAE
jgi:AbrB family looped-hinge helix DNA binding protein